MTQIPIVASAADLPEAIKFAARRPTSRWYVAERARALGHADEIPVDWAITAAMQGPAVTEDEKKVIDQDVAEGKEDELPASIVDPDGDGDDDLVKSKDTDHDGAAYRKRLGLVSAIDFTALVAAGYFDDYGVEDAYDEYDNDAEISLTASGALPITAAFTADQRQEYAKKGVAMDDGSFPIPNRRYLKKAIRAVGRASDPEAAKRHIKKRAKALGLTTLLPDSYNTVTASATDLDEDKQRLRDRMGTLLGKSNAPLIAAGLEHDLSKAAHGFEEAMHPRGKDGKFITKGGRVITPHGEGVVQRIDSNVHGTSVTVALDKAPSIGAGKVQAFSPKQLTNAPTAHATLGQAPHTSPTTPQQHLDNAQFHVAQANKHLDSASKTTTTGGFETHEAAAKQHREAAAFHGNAAREMIESKHGIAPSAHTTEAPVDPFTQKIRDEHQERISNLQGKTDSETVRQTQVNIGKRLEQEGYTKFGSSYRHKGTNMRVTRQNESVRIFSPENGSTSPDHTVHFRANDPNRPNSAAIMDEVKKVHSGEIRRPRAGNDAMSVTFPKDDSPKQHPAHAALSSELERAGLSKSDASNASAGYLDAIGGDSSDVDPEMIDQAMTQHLAEANRGDGPTPEEYDHLAKNVIDPKKYPEAREALGRDYDAYDRGMPAFGSKAAEGAASRYGVEEGRKGGFNAVRNLSSGSVSMGHHETRAEAENHAASLEAKHDDIVNGVPAGKLGDAISKARKSDDADRRAILNSELTRISSHATDKQALRDRAAVHTDAAVARQRAADSQEIKNRAAGMSADDARAQRMSDVHDPKQSTGPATMAGSEDAKYYSNPESAAAQHSIAVQRELKAKGYTQTTAGSQRHLTSPGGSHRVTLKKDGSFDLKTKRDDGSYASRSNSAIQTGDAKSVAESLAGHGSRLGATQSAGSKAWQFHNTEKLRAALLKGDIPAEDRTAAKNLLDRREAKQGLRDRVTKATGPSILDHAPLGHPREGADRAQGETLTTEQSKAIRDASAESVRQESLKRGAGVPDLRNAPGSHPRDGASILDHQPNKPAEAPKRTLDDAIKEAQAKPFSSFPRDYRNTNADGTRQVMINNPENGGTVLVPHSKVASKTDTPSAKLTEWEKTPVGQDQKKLPLAARELLAREPSSTSSAYHDFAAKAAAEPTMPASQKNRIADVAESMKSFNGPGTDRYKTYATGKAAPGETNQDFTPAGLISNAEKSFGTDRSKWTDAQVRQAASLGDPKAAKELTARKLNSRK